MKAVLCDGSPWPAHGGSFVGHVLPGAFLVAWGLHWFVSSTYQALTGERQQPRGAAHHGVPGVRRLLLLRGGSGATPRSGRPAAPRRFWQVAAWALQNFEPLVKVVFPIVAIILEFQLSGTRRLRCPPGTAKGGELDVQHANSWSHATNYPPLVLSGLVDLLHGAGGRDGRDGRRPAAGPLLLLPRGAPHFALGAAFGGSAFLMLAHAKAEALDAALHRLLGWCMAAVAAVVLAQGAAAPDSRGLSAAKSLALLMEGCWFLAIAHIMFSRDATWGASHPGDATRTMFVPVLFAWIFFGLVAALLLLHLGMWALLRSLGLLRDQAAAPQDGGASGALSSGRQAGRSARRYAKLGQQELSDDAASFDGCSTDTAIEMV